MPISLGVYSEVVCVNLSTRLPVKQLANFKTGGKQKCSLPTGAEARAG